MCQAANALRPIVRRETLTKLDDGQYLKKRPRKDALRMRVDAQFLGANEQGLGARAMTMLDAAALADIKPQRPMGSVALRYGERKSWNVIGVSRSRRRRVHCAVDLRQLGRSGRALQRCAQGLNEQHDRHVRHQFAQRAANRRERSCIRRRGIGGRAVHGGFLINDG